MLVISVRPTKTSPAMNELVTIFPCTVGSGSTNDVVINNPTVLPKHLKIELQGETLIAREVQGGSLSHEGRKVSQIVLHSNKTLLLGEVRIDFSITAKQGAIKQIPRAAQVISATTANTRAAPPPEATPAKPAPIKGSAGSTVKFAAIAAILFAIFKINASYLKPSAALSGGANLTTAQALKDLAPEITDLNTAPAPQALATATPNVTCVGDCAPQNIRPPALPNSANTDSQTASGAAAAVTQPSQSSTLLIENMGLDAFRPARTMPEKALSLVTDHAWAPKFFILLAWALILGAFVRLRSPETPLAVPTFRAMFVFGLLLGLAQLLRGVLPVLNFNIDDHESFTRLAGLLVIGLSACAFQAVMHFLMPEDSFQKKTVLAAGLTIASSLGFAKAAQFGLIDLNQRTLPFKGTIAFPIKTFNPQMKSTDNLNRLIDEAIKQTK